MFISPTHVETVVLLSHKKADSYIHIDVEFGEGEGKIPVDSIAKRAEAYVVIGLCKRKETAALIS